MNLTQRLLFAPLGSHLPLPRRVFTHVCCFEKTDNLENESGTCWSHTLLHGCCALCGLLPQRMGQTWTEMPGEAEPVIWGPGVNHSEPGVWCWLMVRGQELSLRGVLVLEMWLKEAG